MDHKIAVLVAVSLLVAAAFGYFFVDFVLKNNFWSLFWALLIGIVYLVLLLLKTTLIKSGWGDFTAIALDIIIISAFFWGHWNLWLWLAAAITIFSLWTTAALMQNIMKNSVKFRLWEMSRHFFRPTFLALTFFVVAVYISFINPQQIGLPKDAVDYLVNLGYQTSPIALRVSPEVLSEYIYQNLSLSLQSLPLETKTSLLILAGLAALAIVGSFSFLISWLGLGLSWLIFRLLLTGQFIKIKKEKVDKETLSL